MLVELLIRCSKLQQPSVYINDLVLDIMLYTCLLYWMMNMREILVDK